MNEEMIKYILMIAKCKYTHKLEIKNEEKVVKLYNINEVDYLQINDTTIDIEDCTHLKWESDMDFPEEIHLIFYSYDDYGDAGMDLTEQLTLDSKLTTMEKFMIY